MKRAKGKSKWQRKRNGNLKWMFNHQPLNKRVNMLLMVFAVGQFTFYMKWKWCALLKNYKSGFFKSLTEKGKNTHLKNINSTLSQGTGFGHQDRNTNKTLATLAHQIWQQRTNISKDACILEKLLKFRHCGLRWPLSIRDYCTVMVTLFCIFLVSFFKLMAIGRNMLG